MKHLVTRLALVAVEGFVAFSAFGGGLALLRGEFDQYLSVDWLAGTPFTDYQFPGLVLVVGVGGTALLAAATALVQREWAVLISMLAGLVMVGFEVVEAASLDSKVGSALPMVLGLQLLYLLAGLAIFGLAWSLWNREYPGHQKHMIHLGHPG